MSVHICDTSTKPIQLQKGVRQGDIISQKLFTTATGWLLDWTRLGVNINGGYVIHLRFTDVVMAKYMEELGTLLNDLARVSQLVALLMNMDKTKVVKCPCHSSKSKNSFQSSQHIESAA